MQRHGLDWDVLCQVGNWTTESAMWGRPEDDKLKRSVYYVTTKNGARAALALQQHACNCLHLHITLHVLQQLGRQMLHPLRAGC